MTQKTHENRYEQDSDAYNKLLANVPCRNLYHVVQDKKGVAVYHDAFSPETVYDHGIFNNFASVQMYFNDNFKGAGVPLKTNFNGNQQNSLMKILYGK